jgi:hypothetical protein
VKGYPQAEGGDFFQKLDTVGARFGEVIALPGAPRLHWLSRVGYSACHFTLEELGKQLSGFCHMLAEVLGA